MSKPRTPAQIEASRRNGAKGRGPQSAEGRARSAQNALKHGLCAATPALLPDEDAAAFAAHEARLLAEHDPKDAVEEGLVRQLAFLFWRMERVEALEVEVLMARERRPNGNYVGGYHPGSFEMWDARRLDTVLRYRAQVERALFRTLKVLAERRAQRAPDEGGATHEVPARKACSQSSAAVPASTAYSTNEPKPDDAAQAGWEHVQRRSRTKQGRGRVGPNEPGKRRGPVESEGRGRQKLTSGASAIP